MLSAVGVALLSWLSFSSVIDMLNLLYCFGQVIEFCAFLHLRRTQPDLARPYKVPLGLVGMCVLLSFPLAFIGVILSFSSLDALFITVSLTALGVVVYWLLNLAKRYKWCVFEVRGDYQAL